MSCRLRLPFEAEPRGQSVPRQGCHYSTPVLPLILYSSTLYDANRTAAKYEIHIGRVRVQVALERASLSILAA